jgi:hypothetical protein
MDRNSTPLPYTGGPRDREAARQAKMQADLAEARGIIGALLGDVESRATDPQNMHSVRRARAFLSRMQGDAT